MEGIYMQQEKAERITITLPPDMLASIKKEVSSGSYGSTSELIREAMRLWQKKEEEHKARISLIRERLAHSAQSGEPVPLDTAFKSIENLHKQRMKKQSDENI
jgi:antitoxin ParD1/3/4